MKITNVTPREQELQRQVEEEQGHLFAVSNALEAARAERDAIRELMNCYNLGGWTDSLALIQERDALRIAAQAGLDALMAAKKARVTLWKNGCDCDSTHTCNPEDDPLIWAFSEAITQLQAAIQGERK